MKKISLIVFAFLSTLGETQVMCQKQVLFKCFKADGKSDYINLLKINDSIHKGTYYGVEAGPNNKACYYESDFVAVKSGNYELAFALNNYRFVDTLFGKHFKIIYPSNSIGIPEVLKKQMNFLGNFFKGNLKVVRTTNQNLFSSADNLFFVREKM